MNTTLTTDTTYLHAQDSLLSRLLTYTEVPGKEGVPVPYQLRTDDGITGVILLCFFILTYVLSKGKYFLLQQGKDFFSTRERPSFFDEETNLDFRYRLLLVVNTCLVVGVWLFEQFDRHLLPSPHGAAHLAYLGFYAGLCLVYYILKCGFYAFVNRVFFNKNKQKPWMNAYSLIFGVEGVLLFPVLLLLVYFDLSVDKKLILSCIVLLFGKIMLFCKCASIFFGKTYRVFYLIVYFCALEIVPCFILGRTLITISSLHNKILGL